LDVWRSGTFLEKLQVSECRASRPGYEAVITRKAEMLTMQYSLYLCLTKLFTLPNVYMSVYNLGGPSPSHQLVLLVSSNVTSVAPTLPTSLCCW